MSRYLLLFTFALGIQISHQEPQKNKNGQEPSLNSEHIRTVQANDTLLKLLLDPNKSNVTKSEIFDMLHSHDTEFENDLPMFPEDEEVAKIEVDINPNMQAEFVQEPGALVSRDSQNRLREHTAQAYLGGKGSVGAYQTMLAAVMVAVTSLIVIVAYVSIVLWRRAELLRTGAKHELLRNEDASTECRIEL